MKIKKPYTTSSEEKNRIRGLHESVKGKKVINEQTFMWECEPGTCQCIPSGFVPPMGNSYPTLQDCENDQGNCCGRGTNQWKCVKH